MNQEVVLTENELPTEVMQAIKQGRKVVAIKMLRENTGIGLANAKVLVDRAASKHAPQPPRQVLMRDYHPNRRRYIVMTILALLALGAYYLFLWS